MKNFIVIVLLSTVLSSCGFNLEQTAYNFDNFKNTPLWELAQAVRADDGDKVQEIVKKNKLDIDLRDSEYNQTLLALSIANNKRSAFLALLKAGANSNKLIGEQDSSTSFIYAIWMVDNCDVFFVEDMLKHGANPNLQIKNPRPGYYFQNSYPLLVAIGRNDNHAEDCVNLIRLLVDNGADITICFKQSFSTLCDGVITESLSTNSMETLKYFVIEKKITIPDTVIIYGEVNESTKQAFGLKEVLKSKDFEYKDFEDELGKVDRSKMRKTRDEIIDYLENVKK